MAPLAIMWKTAFRGHPRETFVCDIESLAAADSFRERRHIEVTVTTRFDVGTAILLFLINT